MKTKKIILVTFFAAFLIFLDQLSKYLIRAKSGFYICNKNVAWDIQLPTIIFWVAWIAIIVLILMLLKKKCFMHNALYLVLILSGAVSNIIDRFLLGCVIDFIKLPYYPAFNLADVFIVTGTIFLLVKMTKL